MKSGLKRLVFAVASIPAVASVANAELPSASEKMASIAKFYVPDSSALEHFSETQLEETFLGNTVLLALSNNRRRVAHFSRDGLLSIWFPGRDYVGKADFGVIDNAIICIDSTARSATGGGEISCQPISQLVASVGDRMDGDPFELNSRTSPPWVLPAEFDGQSIENVRPFAPNASE